jgi:hypothetical protein
MKILTAKYRDNLKFRLISLISTGMAYCFINSANATVLTIEFTGSGAVGDGSFHVHSEEIYTASGSLISDKSTSDASGTITGQLKYDTARMTPDNDPTPGAGLYFTDGAPSWSSSSLTASPASGLGTPSYEYSSDGNRTELRFAPSGSGGGILSVLDTAFVSPSPFGGEPSNVALYQLSVPGKPNTTLLTTQVVDGKDVPTGIHLANITSLARIQIHQAIWTSNPDNTFTVVIDDWNAPVTNVTIPPIPEPQTYAMLLAGLSLLGWQVRRRSN